MSRAGLTQREDEPKMAPRKTQGCHYGRKKKLYFIILIERRAGAATQMPFRASLHCGRSYKGWAMMSEICCITVHDSRFVMAPRAQVE